MITRSELGERIKRARKESGLRASAINNKIVMRDGRTPSSTFIYRLERGVIEPQMYILEQIAKLTGKPLTYFT